jgi:hypothetical protein
MIPYQLPIVLQEKRFVCTTMNNEELTVDKAAKNTAALVTYFAA